MDKNNSCYICNEERARFDKEGGGFINHITDDHDLWMYVFYIVHLEAKDPTEMTGVESYVHGLYKQTLVSWIPRGEALCLTTNNKNNEGEDMELDRLQTEMDDFGVRFDQLVEKLANLERMAQKKKSN